MPDAQDCLLLSRNRVLTPESIAESGRHPATVIYTNVTLGVQSLVPIPVTFSGQVRFITSEFTSLAITDSLLPRSTSTSTPTAASLQFVHTLKCECFLGAKAFGLENGTRLLTCVLPARHTSTASQWTSTSFSQSQRFHRSSRRVNFSNHGA